MNLSTALASTLENLDKSISDQTVSPASRVIHALTPALAFTGLALPWSQGGDLAPGFSRPLGALVWLLALVVAGGVRQPLRLAGAAMLLFFPLGPVHHAEGLWLLPLAALPAGSVVELALTMPSEITLGESMRVRCQGHILRTSGANPRRRNGVAARLDSYQYLPSTGQEPAAEFLRVSNSRPPLENPRPLPR